MRYKILNPVDINSRYIDAINKELEVYFRDNIYRPLIDLVDSYQSGTIKNADYSVLQRALLEGKVSYYRGYFTGKFNSKITKELKSMGAIYDRKKKGFKLPSSKVPSDVKMTLSISESTWLKTVDKLNEKINDILSVDLEDKLNLDTIISKSLFDLNSDIEQGAKGFAIAPKLSDKNIQDIADNYTNNMRYYIKDFTENNIKSLRDKVNSRTMAGYRYEGLAKEIERSYGVSKSKAKFLARQETNLLVAKFKESRYTEMGIDEYIWQTVVGSPAHPVRPMHKRLDGTVQRFSNPPVVNEKGDRKNPSEDFGCRCKAKPIVRF